MSGDIFRNFMLGQEAGQAQADRRATRNALGLHARDPSAAREQLLRIGNFDALEGLGQYDTQARQERIRARMRGKPGMPQAPVGGEARQMPANAGASQQPMPAQAGGTMAPRALMAPASTQQPLPSPSGAYTVGGADDPALQGAPQQEAEGDADPEAQIRNTDFVGQAVTQIGAGEEYGRLQQFAQAAWEEGDPETWQWASEQMNALHERATSQFMGRLNYLGMAANQLRTVAPQQRIQAAVQMLQQSPLAQGANVQQLTQMIQARADVNGDGSISDEELDGFQRGLMSIEAQFTQQLNERNAETNRINALRSGRGDPLTPAQTRVWTDDYDDDQNRIIGAMGPQVAAALPWANQIGGNGAPPGGANANTQIQDTGLVRAVARLQTGVGVLTAEEVNQTLGPTLAAQLRDQGAFFELGETRLSAPQRAALAEMVRRGYRETGNIAWRAYGNERARVSEVSPDANVDTMFPPPAIPHPDDIGELLASERAERLQPGAERVTRSGRRYVLVGPGLWQTRAVGQQDVYERTIGPTRARIAGAGGASSGAEPPSAAQRPPPRRPGDVVLGPNGERVTSSDGRTWDDERPAGQAAPPSARPGFSLPNIDMAAGATQRRSGESDAQYRARMTQLSQSRLPWVTDDMRARAREAAGQ